MIRAIVIVVIVSIVIVISIVIVNVRVYSVVFDLHFYHELSTSYHSTLFLSHCFFRDFSRRKLHKGETFLLVSLVVRRYTNVLDLELVEQLTQLKLCDVDRKLL